MLQNWRPCLLSAKRFTPATKQAFPARLIHLCEVLGASPEELLAPAAHHLWGENQSKVDLLLACIDKLRGFGDETLQDVFSLLNRLEKSGQNGAASAA